MTEIRCPLCALALPVPSDPPQASQVLDALAHHFSEACAALPTLRPAKPP
jgi:hypothetical protein